MKKQRPPIDGTSYGPIIDTEDYITEKCSRNLEALLLFLFSKRNIPNANRKVSILITGAKGREGAVYRYEQKTRRTFWFLQRLYKQLFKKDFDPEETEIRIRNRLEAYKQQGQKETAWAGWNQWNYIKKVKEGTVSKSNMILIG